MGNSGQLSKLQLLLYQHIEMSDLTLEELAPIKLIVLGDTGVGKSSILANFNNEKFNSCRQPTLGSAFFSKRQTLSNGTTIEFHIWDTAGQQKYHSITSLYYQSAKIALCVYDITSKHSFNVMKRWVDELKVKAPADLEIAIVGNKIDLCESEQISFAFAKEYASSIGAPLLLVSAKQQKNIANLFETAGQLALKQSSPRFNPLRVKSVIRSQIIEKSSCC